MRILGMFSALFFLLVPSTCFADGENLAKEGLKAVQECMKKAAKTVDKNAEKGWKAVNLGAKKT